MFSFKNGKNINFYWNGHLNCKLKGQIHKNSLKGRLIRQSTILNILKINKWAGESDYIISIFFWRFINSCRWNDLQHFLSLAFQYGLRVLCSVMPLQTISCNVDSSIEIRQSFYGVSSAYDTCNKQKNRQNVICYSDITPQVAKM